MNLRNLFSHNSTQNVNSETVKKAVSETTPIQPNKVILENSMSFISSFKTHFEDIGHLFKTLFKNEPSWAHVAATDIAFISPILESITLAIGGTSADTQVMAIVNRIQQSLVLATKFIQDADSSVNLSDVLNAIKADLSILLTLGAIKNSTKVATITNYVNLFVGELNAIIAVLPKVTTPTV